MTVTHLDALERLGLCAAGLVRLEVRRTGGGDRLTWRSVAKPAIT